MTGRKRGFKVLAQCTDRAEKPEASGYPYRLCRCAQGLPGRDKQRLSAGAHSAVHHLHGA